MSRDPSGPDLGVEKAPTVPPRRSGVVGAMVVAVLLGAVTGGALAALLAPDLMVGAALGGALTVGALRVFVFLSSDRRGLAPLEREDGSGQ